MSLKWREGFFTAIFVLALPFYLSALENPYSRVDIYAV
jgi:hypothetical protein